VPHPWQKLIAVTDLDFESSQLQLLTDALRAGPGSPEWRAAMEAVGASSSPEQDEYKLLYAARERLASGRQYRAVRAGPGFTRRVFDAIEQDDSGDGSTPGALPAANLIAAVSALVILGVLAIVAWLIIPSTDTRHQQQANDLSQTYFVNRIVDANFDAGLAADWTPFGNLPLEAKGGLRPGSAGNAPATFVGGGATHRRTIDASQPFAVEASIKIPRPSDDVIVQIFITDSPTFTGDNAMTPRELAWLVRGTQASVATPDGAVEFADAPVRGGGQRINVRLTANQADGAVEMNGQKLWSGPNQLDPKRPRTLGVRFLRQGKVDEKSLPVVESLRVLVPQKQ
jgi:hypothetical protein